MAKVLWKFLIHYCNLFLLGIGWHKIFFSHPPLRRYSYFSMEGPIKATLSLPGIDLRGCSPENKQAKIEI